ncbi:Ribbon-helix-helix domain containing protein [uncultured Caudovirales phage]|uniref:Ribbon-helix-helix domain containing protein n=1 Tax=uncultured Caudovirales phage TaxID=2100421 RepID=A0A6J5LX85_9CAUD|nr:Ribbon-helix-helix domain containing protein [uncultured Caudovirales phage]
MSRLQNRNVSIGLGGQRSSMRLEPSMWAAAEEICHREGITMADLAGKVDATREGGRDRTVAMRVFILAYFRAAATEEGHKAAGHGSLEVLA